MECATNTIAPIPTGRDSVASTRIGVSTGADFCTNHPLDRASRMTTMPALGNALVDALKPLGIREIAMPATPEVLWRAIKDAQISQ